ncbi:MAG: PAS domain S-box protein [Saprospiraceae bacterium]
MRDSNLSMSIDAQQLRAIFETAVDCLIIIDSHGEISKINPAGARLFGYEIKELLGQNISILMPAPHREKHDSYLQNYHKTGVRKIIGVGRDVVGKKKDGTLFPCSLSVNEFFMQSKKCFAGIIHDLTVRKKQEEEILELNRQLEEKVEIKTKDLSEAVNELLETNLRLENEIKERQKIEAALRNNELEIRKALEKEKELNDLKSNFVSMASHEFRTPLSTILSSTTLIEKHIENGSIEKTGRHFNRVMSSVKHLTEMLDDLLSLTKLAEGKIPINAERFMIHEFCEEFLEMNRGLLKSNQELIRKIPTEDQAILLDKKLLNNILLNLFSNAIKYSKEDGKIKCEVEIVDHQLEVKIIDEGIGIPLSEQKHLFTRFFRGANVINIQGTGLGLNIVREYLEVMNGTIAFESIENVGTTFIVKIPLPQ